MASGIRALLENALTQGTAAPQSPELDSSAESAAARLDIAQEEEEEDQMSVTRLSNAALLASSILATHGNAEVSQP